MLHIIFPSEGLFPEKKGIKLTIPSKMENTEIMVKDMFNKSCGFAAFLMTIKAIPNNILK